MPDLKLDKREADWLLKEKYDGKECPAYVRDIEELESGIPLPYVIGHIPFLEATIFLDSRPLIPRVETEYWMTLAIKEMVSHAGEKPKVLDLCAGSGCIGVATLMALTDATVDFVEIDTKHHSTIKKNIVSNDIDLTRTHLYEGDLFENIDSKYAYILSNPPYINPELLERVDESVRAYEPKQALFGGLGGLEVIGHIVRDARAHLEELGQLYIEHEPEQAEDVRELFTACGFTKVKTFRDQYDIERVTLGTFAT